MAMASPATLAGVPLTFYPHACVIVSDPDDERATVLPFVAEGLDSGDQVNVVYPPDRETEIREWLASTIPDLQEAEGSTQLRILDWTAAHLRSGRFDMAGTIEAVEEMTRAGRSAGWTRTRFVGHMGWTSPDDPRVDDVIEYEARVNKVLADAWAPAICVYPMSVLSSRMLVDLMAVHPVVYLAGDTVESPFFVPPERFLATRSQPRHS